MSSVVIAGDTSSSIIVRKEGKEMIVTKETQPVNLVANEWHEI